jgi:hypothetical protein
MALTLLYPSSHSPIGFSTPTWQSEELAQEAIAKETNGVVFHHHGTDHRDLGSVDLTRKGARGKKAGAVQKNQ